MPSRGGTLALTRHGHKTVLLYNVKTGAYERVAEWAAKKKLQFDHVKDGKRYCKVSEIKDYVLVPPPLPKAFTAAAPDKVATKKKAEPEVFGEGEE